MIRRLVVAGIAGVALAPSAWAAPRGKGESGGAFVVGALLGLVLVPSAQVVLAVIAPRFAARAAQAVRAHKLPIIGIGVVAALVAAVLAGVLSSAAGPGGKVLASLVLVAAWALSVPGVTGLSRVLGDRATQMAAPGRDDPAHPLLSVLVGSFCWAWAGLLTVGIGGLACHIVGLGATIYVWARGPALDVVRRGPLLPPPSAAPAHPPAAGPPATPPPPRPVHDDGAQAF